MPNPRRPTAEYGQVSRLLSVGRALSDVADGSRIAEREAVYG